MGETMVKNLGINGQLGAWIIAKDHPPSPGYAAQIAAAAVVSYLIAHLFRLPQVLGTHVDVNRHAVDPECRAAHFCAVCRGDSDRSRSWRPARRLLPC